MTKPFIYNLGQNSQAKLSDVHRRSLLGIWL